jgi:hypothetical protein
VSDIDTVVMDSLKALDPNRPIREALISDLQCGNDLDLCPLSAQPFVQSASPVHWFNVSLFRGNPSSPFSKAKAAQLTVDLPCEGAGCPLARFFASKGLPSRLAPRVTSLLDLRAITLASRLQKGGCNQGAFGALHSSGRRGEGINTCLALVAQLAGVSRAQVKTVAVFSGAERRRLKLSPKYKSDRLLQQTLRRRCESPHWRQWKP